jgi:hypothetical protein
MNIRNRTLVGIAAGAAVASSLMFAPGSASADTTVTYNAQSGTHTEQAHQNTNYCSNLTTVTVNNSSTAGKRAYHAFTTAVPSGNTITSATLKLYSHQTSATNVNVYKQTTWINFPSGCSLKWSNQPAPGTLAGSSTSGQTLNTYTSIPITASLVPTAGTIGFMINSQGTSDLGFDTDGTAHPPQLVLTYAPTAVQQAPTVTTGSASALTDTTATLGGTVNPNGAATTYHFEYGPTTFYGGNVPIPDGSAGSGSAVVSATANAAGLTASTLYHFRLVATNSAGTTNGADATFTTTAAACGSPITISTGGTYSGCYQSTSTSVPAVAIATTSAVTLSHAHIIQKGNGVMDSVAGVNVTIQDSTFDQTDPGASVNHRAVWLDQAPASYTSIHNQFNQTDGQELQGPWTGTNTISPFVVRDNLSYDVGRYPHTDPGGNCCVQFLQLDHETVPGGQVQYNRMVVTSGTDQYADGDQVNFYFSGGTSTNMLDISHNLVDGAYPATPTDHQYTGGGILAIDGGTVTTAGHVNAHDNTVVSTTNYGVACAGGVDCHAYNNVTINDRFGSDGTTLYDSDFGGAYSMHDTASSSDVTSGSYNWTRNSLDGQQACWMSAFCSGLTLVSTTEAQARTDWTNSIPSGELPIGVRP